MPSVATEDQEIIKSILVRKNVEVKLIIQAEDEVEKILRACGDGAKSYDERGNYLKYVLASGMLLSQHHKKLWRGKFKNWEDFCNAVIYRRGFERATAKKHKRIVEKWGNVPIHRIAKIPVQNMLLISRFSDQTQTSWERDLTAAETMSLEELQQYAAGRGHDRDATTDASIKITGTLGQIRDIQRYLSNLHVHKVTGTESQAENLICAIREMCGTHGIGV